MLSRVTWSRAGRAGRARASGARMTVPPTHQGANSSKTARSKVTAVAARTPARSAGVKCWVAHWRKATALAWLMATALGVPVEPEVVIR